MRQTLVACRRALPPALAAVLAVTTLGAAAPEASAHAPLSASGQSAYRAPAFAARLPAGTTQVVRTVRSNNWCRRVYCTKTQAWHRVNGKWRIVRRADGTRAVFRSSIGPNGFAPVGQRREGDGRTPSGIYRIAVTFSTSETNPGAMPWRRRLPTSNVTNYHNRYYNTWIEESWRTDGDRPAMRYGFWVGYNNPRLEVGVGPKPVIGRGSGIFYHTSKPTHRWAPTQGCTNVGWPRQMRWILLWLRPEAKPRVVNNV